MPKYATRHEDREKTFALRNFPDGLNREISAPALPPTTLTKCKNMKYVYNQSIGGEKLVILKKRQGTTKISSSALGSSVLACTYYIADAHYIVATATTLHELDSGTFAVSSSLGTLSGTPTFTEFNGKLIIHDSGVTKVWDGTTFAALGGLHTDEIIGTGDNFGTTAFSGTLESPPITAGTLIITFTDSTGRTMTDNGAGAFTGYGTGTINYTTGAWSITATGAPDNLTSIYAAYTTTAGAPKSKGGFVRASRLYMWGDSDYPSRLWYSAPNDETSWEGYLDVDPLDGFALIACLNYFQSIIAVKGSSVHRINGYPGDTTFSVQPLMQNIGAVSHRGCLSANNMVSFVASKQGWLAMRPTQEYGDISQTTNLSSRFKSEITAYTNSDAYAEYNGLDNQLWLSLFSLGDQLQEVYVLNMETGGQLSMYEFSFGHTSYKYVNNEMLIGGSDGNLYRLNHDSGRYTDNAVSYSADTFIRGTMTDFETPFNRKHNKRITLYCYGKAGMTGTLNIYADNDYTTPKFTQAIDLTSGRLSIFYDGPNYRIYDMSTMRIGGDMIGEQDTRIRAKFNYRELMFELTSIAGSTGAEFYGIDFVSALQGD